MQDGTYMCECQPVIITCTYVGVFVYGNVSMYSSHTAYLVDFLIHFYTDCWIFKKRIGQHLHGCDPPGGNSA